MSDLISRQETEWHDYLVADGNGIYHNEKVAYKSQVDMADMLTKRAYPWLTP